MTKINTYLTFNGNCREAMAFYRGCFGGTLTFQTVGELPGADQLPGPMKRFIVQATLVNDQLILIGSDMVSEQGLTTGNAISLMLRCSNEDELKAYYAKLLPGGTEIHTPENTYWGALFGVLQDRYGHQWLLSC
ncbi:VOC family protein [Fulvivirgaceae bacterium PWU4]|uniref:VOC family protein n=1 Tax=Chryseosolibacter histidini TaxID=2782349 RepID=A0AAP2GLH2_9BACT|nr:VOC family protein [Chryseosolibacter histidini]MBT1700119.1 VOC family protein [Chryseosolibacter histidini]